jgi:glyceraldehyde-3-phosphate dehydrogenase/erythrose-4-phosphate dehydrogenase
MFNVALFGAGRIGQIHARNAAARSDLKLKFHVTGSAVSLDPVALDKQIPEACNSGLGGHIP